MAGGGSGECQILSRFYKRGEEREENDLEPLDLKINVRAHLIFNNLGKFFSDFLIFKTTSKDKHLERLF